MRPLLILLIVLGQTGCLLAPPRPGGSGDDDDCLATDAKLGLSAVAALDSPDHDTLIRAGHTGNDWYLYFYPSTAKTSLCPARTFPLTGDGIVSVDAIEPAIVMGTTPDLLVLVSFANKDSAVIDVRSTAGALSEAGRVVISDYRPIPIDTPSGPRATGFVALRANDQIWFGGGPQGFAVASVTSGIRGTAKLVTVDPPDGWYHAVPVRQPHDVYKFALIGAFGSYEAMYTSLSGINNMLVTEHYGVCVVPDCHDRLTRNVSTSDPLDTAELFSIDRTNGELETITSLTTDPKFGIASHTTMDRGPGSVLDAASGELFGASKTDVAMLWGSGTMRELITYEAMLKAPMVSSTSQVSFDAKLDRIAILHTNGPTHILLLADDPHADPERCLQVNGATLADCP